MNKHKIHIYRCGFYSNVYISHFPDPLTKKFLVDICDPVFGYPQLVRFSWSTSEVLLEKHAYHVEWEDPAEEAANAERDNTLTITSFFKAAPSKKPSERKQHEFFTQRGLSRKVEL